MKLQQIEALLLQEMEEVRGGLVGTCECDSGAGQASESGGTCSCKKGAGQLISTPDTYEKNPNCICPGGGAGQ